jgi:hypothetical protein
MFGTMKRWYVTVLIVECRVGKNAAELWDQQVRLVRALSPQEALAQANRLGQAENTRYKNSEGKLVAWRFVGLGELAELDGSALRSGVEVLSTLTRECRPRILRKHQLNVFWLPRNLHKKASDLLGKELKQFAPT